MFVTIHSIKIFKDNLRKFNNNRTILSVAGRLDEAINKWKAIIKFLQENDFYMEAEWPKRELQRIEKKRIQ
ncbi:hypothetical protein J2TS4_13120 [Paenibacillus sp. J2TS4]|nr:hypothetical protein J2TS4_13120 [Paenibacillus sp. J2TS4]